MYTVLWEYMLGNDRENVVGTQNNLEKLSSIWNHGYTWSKLLWNKTLK